MPFYYTKIKDNLMVYAIGTANILSKNRREAANIFKDKNKKSYFLEENMGKSVFYVIGKVNPRFGAVIKSQPKLLKSVDYIG